MPQYSHRKWMCLQPSTLTIHYDSQCLFNMALRVLMDQVGGAASLAILEQFLVLPPCCPLSIPLSTAWAKCYPTVHSTTKWPWVPTMESQETRMLPPCDPCCSDPLYFPPHLLIIPHIQACQMSFSCTYHGWVSMSLLFYKDPEKIWHHWVKTHALNLNPTSQENFFLYFFKIISHFCSMAFWKLFNEKKIIIIN